MPTSVSEAISTQPLARAPFFGGFYQQPPDAVAAVFRLDEPALKVTHVIGIAIFHKGADAGFEKPGKASPARVRHQHELGHGVFDAKRPVEPSESLQVRLFFLSVCY